jgi:dihydroflavonol-4-reductase
MRPTLLTGGTGIVGNSIARALVESGVQVRALVRSPEAARAILPAGVALVAGDVTDADSVRRAVDGCAVVYHAAGLPEQWLRDEATFERVNVGGTRHLVEAALAAGVERFVYTSTIDVFAMTPGEEFDETRIDGQAKGTAYERSKQAADRLVTDALGRGLRAVFLHPAGVYGPIRAGSPGTNDFIAQLVRGEIPMLLPGGMPLVFCHDVARGHLLAAERAAIGARFILSERYLTLLEVAQAVHAQQGATVPRMLPAWFASIVATVGEWVSALTGRPPLVPSGQLHFLTSDVRPSSRRAQQELGWRPHPFADGLRETLAFLRQSGAI